MNFYTKDLHFGLHFGKICLSHKMDLGGKVMPKSPNQKKKLLVLWELLLKHSDEEHPISIKQMIEDLERHDIKAERKSLYDDMETLRDFGLDVQSRKGSSPGWFIGERDFELAELKLLVDAVQSSKFVTRKKSDSLIRKLEGLASVHQAKALQRQVYVSGRIKTMNESIYYNVDKLHAAVGERRSVRFRYFDYNSRKEKVFRREGRQYAVTPYGLVWDNENYYLVGADAEKGDVRHYRVDKMYGIELGEKAPAAEFDMARYAQKHFGMFSGVSADVKLKVKDEMAGIVLDRFGQDVILVPGSDGTFTVTVGVVVSPQFWGWVFGLGDGVEVCSPTWAVEEFKERLEKVRGLY